MTVRRNKKRHDPHVRIYNYELTCPAYRTLSVAARALLVEFRALYRGGENRIHMSVREVMRRLGVGQKAAQKALNELIERGWIRVMEKGAFHRKTRHATVYALENEPIEDKDGAVPPKNYTKWKP